jgi:hypothetical protein
MQAFMNSRFEAVDKRFEDLQRSMDKRFESVDKRISMVQWMLAGATVLITVLMSIYTFVA